MTTLACTVSGKSLTKNFTIPKYGKKENWTNTGKNKQEKADLQSNGTACHHQSVHQI